MTPPAGCLLVSRRRAVLDVPARGADAANVEACRGTLRALLGCHRRRPVPLGLQVQHPGAVLDIGAALDVSRFGAADVRVQSVLAGGGDHLGHRDTAVIGE